MYSSEETQIANNTKTIIGMDVRKRRLLIALKSRQAVFLYGPTGTAKTILAWSLANELSRIQGTPIYYLQLYPEMTKNSLIGGETLRGGDIVVETQLVVTAGETGAIFIVDEATHTTEPVLLAFNSLIEEPYSTTVGKKQHYMHPNTRFIFCGNYADHVGNIPLPISFANRLFIDDMSKPERDMLVAIGRMVNSEIPNEILGFLAEIIDTCYEPAFPISPRNMVLACRIFSDLKGTGYKDIGTKSRTDVHNQLKKNNIDPELFKEIILSTMMAHIRGKSMGPDKVKALLW